MIKYDWIGKKSGRTVYSVVSFDFVNLVGSFIPSLQEAKRPSSLAVRMDCRFG